MLVLNKDEDVDAESLDMSENIVKVVAHTIKFRVAKLFIGPRAKENEDLLYYINLHLYFFFYTQPFSLGSSRTACCVFIAIYSFFLALCTYICTLHVSL